MKKNATKRVSRKRAPKNNDTKPPAANSSKEPKAQPPAKLISMPASEVIAVKTLLSQALILQVPYQTDPVKMANMAINTMRVLVDTAIKKLPKNEDLGIPVVPPQGQQPPPPPAGTVPFPPQTPPPPAP